MSHICTLVQQLATATILDSMNSVSLQGSLIVLVPAEGAEHAYGCDFKA